MEPKTTRYPALPVDHTAFHQIDTPQKAYAIGFLLADGCVREPTSRARSRVNLRIKTEDIEACRMVQQIAGGNLHLIEDGYRAMWEVSSDAIAADLNILGITPRKSFTAALQWNRIASHLHGAVLAGLIDGDGHLRFDRKGRRAEISIVTASPSLRDQVQEQFPFFKTVIFSPSGNRKSPLFQLVVENNRTLLKALISQVYESLPFPILDRKQKVLDQIRAYLEDQDAYDRGMDEVPALMASGLTQEQIAVRLGTSVRPVRERLLRSGYDGKVVKFTAEDLEEMKLLHERGLTVLQIHAVIGKATEEAVRYRLQRMGCLSKTKQANTRHPMAAEVLRLNQTGIPAFRIAEQVHLGRILVCKILHQEGISLCRGSALKLPTDGIVWAEAEMQKGRTITSVAKELGVSTTLIRIRLNGRAKLLQQG